MLTRKPKRTELLRLFLGQPVAMTAFLLVITFVLSGLAGMTSFVWNLFYPGGQTSFLPTQDVVVAAVYGGIALGVFNIAGDSAEMDTVLKRRTPSVITYLLLSLSLTFVAGALHTLAGGTYLTQYVSTSALSLLGTQIAALAEVLILRWHFRYCLKEASVLR